MVLIDNLVPNTANLELSLFWNCHNLLQNQKLGVFWNDQEILLKIGRDFQN